tara:strand:+ start:225 stop:2111 length:1887 start_codon:yes stop_codon:yes gene_type:complete
MPSLGLASSLSKGVTALSSYVRDGLKLYMPHSSPKEVKFVGQGSTSFDYSNTQYVNCGTDSSLTVGTSDFTACAWVKLSSKGGGSYHDIVARGDTLATGNGWGLNLNENDNKIWFDISASGTRNSLVSNSNAWEYNKWHHVAVSTVKSTNIMNIYLDGVLIKSGVPANVIDDIEDSSSSFGIGKSDKDTRYANGSIKNVGFWKRALSDTEVQNVMYKTYSELSGTLKQALNGWWALEGDYLDSTGNGNNGTNNGSTANTSLYGGTTPLIPRGVDNAPVVQADAIGTGYATFNGSSDYINCGSDSSLDVGSSDFSACCWFKLEEQTTGDLNHDIMGKCFQSFSSSGNTEGWSVAFLESDKTVRFEVGETSGKEDAISNPISYGRWYHVAVTRDNVGNSIKIYIDGVLHQEDDSHLAGYLDDSDRSFKIGGSERTLKGNIKNVGFWKGTILTQAQIQSIMEKTYSELTSSEKTNLISWWGLDSAVGEGLTHVADEHNESLGSELIVNANLSAGGAGAPTFNDDKSVIIFSADSNADSYVTHSSIIPEGKVYKFSYTVDSYTSGGLSVWETTYGSASARALDLTVGDHFIYMNGRDNSQLLLDDLGGGDDDIFTLSNLSVKEVLGNYGVLI